MHFACKKPSTVWQTPLLQPHTTALHQEGKQDTGGGQEKPASSMDSEVIARDKLRGRCRLETVISSAYENDVQL